MCFLGFDEKGFTTNSTTGIPKIAAKDSLPCSMPVFGLGNEFLA